MQQSPVDGLPLAMQAPTVIVKPRILVVDDQPEITWLISASISDALDAEVECAETGWQVLGKFAQRRPYDLILLDLIMPGMDGFRLLPLLKAKCPSVPVIAMSAGPYKSLAVEAGCDGYLAKPFEISVLVEKLGFWLARDRQLKQPDIAQSKC